LPVFSVAAIHELIDTLKGGTLHAEEGIPRFAIQYMRTHHYVSTEKAKRELGYQPKVSIVERFACTVAWLRQKGMLRST
jgi:sterol-4alpha-carboxylate 3-dehydrogenase (decarboxylating)